MPLEHLIYVSTARTELGSAELERIIESAVRRNTANGLTGMLLYSRGTFLQVLEGETAALDECWQRLLADPRHHGLTEIVREPVAERSFPGWAMGFRAVGSKRMAGNPDFVPLTLNGFDAGKLGARPGLALGILLDFARH